MAASGVSAVRVAWSNFYSIRVEINRVEIRAEAPLRLAVLYLRVVSYRFCLSAGVG